MSVVLSPLAGAGWQFFSDSGFPLSGGLLYTYAAGTTTPQVTYTNSSGTIANSNPIVLDAAGRVPNEIWLTENQNYKFVLNDSTGNLIGNWDNLNVYPFSTDLANTTDPTKGDALVGFRQSNSSGNLPGAVGRTVHQKLQEIVSVADFGASPTASAATNTAAIQAAINYAGTVVRALTFNQLITLVEVHIPAGTYQVTGTIALNPGVMLVGDGSQSTILQHAGGNVSCIQAGTHLVPNGITPNNWGFTKMGGIKQLTIEGKPDPSFNWQTIIGRVGKTNLTKYGMELDGAWGEFIIEDVDVYYCQSGLWADRSYFLNGHRLRIFFSSGHGAMVYGSNLFKFIACDFQQNSLAGFFLDRQEVGTGEITKASLFQSCDFESNLYQGAYITNYNTVEFDSCYFENNMLYNEDFPSTANQELYVDSNGGFNRILLIKNTIFNAFAQSGANVDVVYFNVADQVTIENSNFFNTYKQRSLIRFGVNVFAVNWISSLLYGNGAALGGNSPVIYDKGCLAYSNNMQNTLPYKNMIINGQLQSWQKGTTGTVTGGTQFVAADGWGIYEFDSGSINVSQQSFSAIQTDVPGYPNYYLRMQQTVASNSWGIYFRVRPTQFFTKNTTVSFGFWIKAASQQDITVGVTRVQSGGTNLSGAPATYTIGTDWQYISYIESLYQDLTQNPQNPANFLLFYIGMANGVNKVTGTFDIANAQAEVGNFPTSIGKVDDSQNLDQCQEYFIQTSTDAVVYSGEVVSGNTYVVSVRFPRPMRTAPTVTILAGTETNMAGTVTVTNITQNGFVVSVAADGTGYGEWLVGYRASAYF